MTNFEKYDRRFKSNGATKVQLHRLTELGALTSEEFETITGDVFEA